MQVRQLEEIVGIPLTELIGKKIFMTNAGSLVARHVRLVERQLISASEELDAVRGGQSGHMSIGIISTAKYFVPRLITHFRTARPDIEIHLSVSNRKTIIRQLDNNEIDLAIMGTPPSDFPTDAIGFADHPLYIVAGAEHPLSCCKKIKISQLHHQTFILREKGSGTRSVAESFFDKHHIQCGQILELDSNETIKQALMANWGLAFISTYSVALECRSGYLVRLPVSGMPIIRHWFVVTRKEKTLQPLGQAFREFLLQEAPGFLKAAS